MTPLRLLLLGLLAIAIKGMLALVPQVGWLADPLLAVSVLSALPGRRWQAMVTGLLAGGFVDAMFGPWLGLHAFSQMTIAFSLALIANRVDLLQPVPAMLAMAVAALADWGIQIGLAVLFNRTADVVPGPFIWLAAVAANTIIGLLFYRLAARRGTLA